MKTCQITQLVCWQLEIVLPILLLCGNITLPFCGLSSQKALIETAPEKQAASLWSAASEAVYCSLHCDALNILVLWCCLFRTSTNVQMKGKGHAGTTASNDPSAVDGLVREFLDMLGDGEARYSALTQHDMKYHSPIQVQMKRLQSLVCLVLS